MTFMSSLVFPVSRTVNCDSRDDAEGNLSQPAFSVILGHVSKPYFSFTRNEFYTLMDVSCQELLQFVLENTADLKKSTRNERARVDVIDFKASLLIIEA